MMTLTILPNDPEFAEFVGALNGVGSGTRMSITEDAFDTLTSSVRTAWNDAVGSQHTITRHKNNPFSYTLSSDDKKDPMVRWLESGLQSFDMKLTHPKGAKSRVVKPRRRPDGTLRTEWKQRRKDGTSYTVHANDSYLVVPFRHWSTQQNPPSKMSLSKYVDAENQKNLNTQFSEVYSSAQTQMRQPGFQRSSIKQSAEESGRVSPNYWGKMVERATYEWGSRLQFPKTPENANLQGMIVMGPPKQSQFMSFRVVSVNSPEGSWIHPGIKARHYLQNIIEDGKQTFEIVLANAMRQDLS